MNHQIQRVAHRGGSHLAPENTLAAFRNESERIGSEEARRPQHVGVTLTRAVD